MEWLLIWLVVESANVNRETNATMGYETAHWVFSGKQPFSDCLRARSALAEATVPRGGNRNIYQDIYVCVPLEKK